jgi:uncharacterized protein
MKKAIITGASSGLGYEIAQKLIKKRIEVVNLSRTPSKLNVKNIKTDLTNDKDIKNAISIIKKEHKDSDLLILCAGVLHWHEMGDFPNNEIDKDFAVNITGTIKLTNGLMQIIKENHGDVVIIGSTSSFVSYGRDSVYVSAKHAVLGFIKGLQAEYKKEDVRIIGFHPGGFNSHLHVKEGSGLDPKDLMNPKDLANLIMNVLELPRNVEVSEIIVNRKKKNK